MAKLNMSVNPWDFSCSRIHRREQGMIICETCRQTFADEETYIEHLIKHHTDEVRDYLNRKVGATSCPGGCGRTYVTRELSPVFVCPCGYRIGRWAFRWAARFIVAKGGQRDR